MAEEAGSRSSAVEGPQAIASAESSHRLGPTPPQERIILIDILRGWALIGIIAANMRGFAGPLTAYFQPSLVWKTRLDFWVQAFIDSFIQGKFLTIFAFLFGVGFILQFTRAEQRHARFVRFYVRRLLALILIGALHQLLFWWGDILITYALGGLLLIPFRKRRNKTILIWALSLLLLPIVGGAGFTLFRHLRPLPQQIAAANQKKAAAYREQREAEMWKTIKVYQTGNYLDIFKERLGELKRQNATQPMAVGMTLPIFLLGLWVWRQGILQNPAAHRELLKKALIVGAVIGIPANLAATWIMHVTGGFVQTRPMSPPSPLLLFGFLLVVFGRPALSMSYACAVALLFLNDSWHRRILPFAAVGRTALSNYLFQTVVGTTIFYGYGGGLFGRVNLAWLFLLSLAVFAVQVWISRRWLAHYRFGPAEWIWRTLTYGKAQVDASVRQGAA